MIYYICLPWDGVKESNLHNKQEVVASVDMILGGQELFWKPKAALILATIPGYSWE